MNKKTYIGFTQAQTSFVKSPVLSVFNFIELALSSKFIEDEQNHRKLERKFAELLKLKKKEFLK